MNEEQIEIKQSVRLEKATKGYFLTIGDDVVNNRWAITTEELLCLFFVVRDEVNKIVKEYDKTR